MFRTLCHLAAPIIAFAFSPVAHADESTHRIEVGTKKLPMEGESILFDGHEAFVIAPETAAKGKPWVWYAPTLPRLPGSAENWLFERFLKAGVAIAGVDVGESYGSPEGRKIFEEFRVYLVSERGFAEKPCLLARSRGGLMLYSWATEHPEKVAGVAGIYPVCNIASYPGVAKAAGAYGLSPEALEAELAKHNPIDRLEPLAKAKVPILHLHGDKDRTVPLEANSGELAKRYRALGGPIELEVVKEGGHDMWKGWFQSEKMAAFVIERAKAGVGEE
ncbi:alpha/beta hydrolase family protein [Haloferula helveola]